MDDLSFQIEIPSDSDGFVLLQCPLCRDFFKLTAKDIKAEDVLEIWCPSCGLKSESYLTDEIIELAQRIIKNNLNDIIHKRMKEMERKTRGSLASFKAGSKANSEYEFPIVPGIDDELETQKYKCCNKSAKISPSVKLEGSYCPFCGISYDKYQ